jgi:hypothetical protein
MRCSSLLILSLLAACSDPAPPVPAAAAPPSLPIEPSGFIAPVILYPRHRILSPAPPIVLAVPADASAVTLDLRTSRGLRRRIRTRKRILPWPEETHVLEDGETGTIQLSGASGTARAFFVRVRRGEPLTIPWGTAKARARELLGQGLPMEALRLLALSGEARGSLAREAALRADLPTFGFWSPEEGSDSIAAK